MIPGFRVIDKGVTPPYKFSRRDPVTLTMLLADVARVKCETHTRVRSDSEAIHVLATSPRFEIPWGTLRYSERSLKNWLVDAHNPRKNILLPLWPLAETTGQVENLVKIFNSERFRASLESKIRK